MYVRKPLWSALLSIAAYSVWVGVDTLSKLAAENLTVFERCFFSLGIASLVFLAFSFRGRGFAELYTRKPLFHLLRGVTFFGGVTFLNYAIGHMPLANLFAVLFTFPLTVALVGRLIGEKLGKIGAIAILLGFVGAMIAVGPAHLAWADWDVSSVGAALASNLCFCFYSMTVKRGGNGESLTALAFYPACLTAFVLAILLTLQNAWVWEPLSIGYVCLAGLLNGMAWFAFVTAFRYGSDTYVVTFSYVQIVIGAFLGWLIWGDVLTFRLIVGALVVMLSGLYVLWDGVREGKKQEA